MNLQTTQNPLKIFVALALCMALQMTGFVMILPLLARRFESFGAGVEALTISAMAYALTSTASAWMVILLRGLAGVFTAGLISAITSSVGDLASENRRAQWIGIVNGGASAGWIVGPLFGSLLYDRFGYEAPFASAIAMAVGALLLAVFLIPETYALSAHPGQPRMTWMRDIKTFASQRTFLLLMFVSFSVMFAWAFIEPRFMFYAYDDLGWTSTQLGLIMSTYGVAFMCGEFFLSHLSDRLGRKPVLVLGLALFSAQFVGLVIFRDATWIVVSFILAGLGNAIYDPALSAHILDIAPPEHRARVMGIKSTVGSLGNLLGPGLVVMFIPFMSPQMVFLISAGLVLILAFISAMSLRTRQLSNVSRYESRTVVIQHQ